MKLKVEYEIELSESALKLNEGGWAEYRDSSHDSWEDVVEYYDDADMSMPDFYTEASSTLVIITGLIKKWLC